HRDGSATLLPGGVVLFAAGGDQTGAPSTACDLFQQSSAGDTCTVSGSSGECESLVCNGGICCSGACAGPCRTCKAGRGACLVVSGADDPDSCTNSQTCSVAGACTKKPGQSCASSAECASSFCADNFCCDTACPGACQQCFKTPGPCSA